MTRLFATIRYDSVLQWRNGFYYVTFIMTAFWALLLPQASSLNLRWLMPAMLIGNLLIGTFFFLGGLVLLEKDERTPMALRVTPLRFGEYLSSKIITLAIPAIAETIVIAGLVVGWQFDLSVVLLGLVLAIAIYCLIGHLAVARASSLNSYLLPAGGYAALLWVPLVGQLAGWNTWLVLLNPLGGPLVLVAAGFEPIDMGTKSLAIATSILWIILLAIWGRRQRKNA